MCHFKCNLRKRSALKTATADITEKSFLTHHKA